MNIRVRPIYLAFTWRRAARGASLVRLQVQGPRRWLAAAVVPQGCTGLLRRRLPWLRREEEARGWTSAREMWPGLRSGPSCLL